MKTADLTGPALDWAVAKCEGLNVGVLTVDDQVREHEDLMRQHFSDAEWEEHLKVWNKHVLPSIKPRLVVFDEKGFPKGYPLHYDGRGHRIAYATDWAQGGPIIEREIAAGMRLQKDFACYYIGGIDSFAHLMRGPTPLIAAMRCYVAKKLSDEVDVPKELLV